MTEENIRYFVTVTRWTDLEESKYEKLKVTEISDPSVFDEMKKHATPAVEDGKIIAPEGFAFQYILEDSNDEYLDDFWTNRELSME